MRLPRAIVPLTELPIGQRGIVKELRADKRVRRRMLDFGLVTDTVVEALCKSPSGDPTAYFFRGVVIALRADEATAIIIEKAALLGDREDNSWD